MFGGLHLRESGYDLLDALVQRFEHYLEIFAEKLVIKLGGNVDREILN